MADSGQRAMVGIKCACEGQALVPLTRTVLSGMNAQPI